MGKAADQRGIAVLSLPQEEKQRDDDDKQKAMAYISAAPDIEYGGYWLIYQVRQYSAEARDDEVQPEQVCYGNGYAYVGQESRWYMD